jgi:hypothetical protein
MIPQREKMDPVDLSALGDLLGEQHGGPIPSQIKRRPSVVVVKMQHHNARRPVGKGFFDSGTLGKVPVLLVDDSLIHKMDCLMMIALFYTSFFTTYQVAFSTVDQLPNSEE